MSEDVIIIKNLTKLYELGKFDFSNFFKKFSGKKKIIKTALKNINININQASANEIAAGRFLNLNNFHLLATNQNSLLTLLK